MIKNSIVILIITAILFWIILMGNSKGQSEDRLGLFSISPNIEKQINTNEKIDYSLKEQLIKQDSLFSVTESTGVSAKKTKVIIKTKDNSGVIARNKLERSNRYDNINSLALTMDTASIINLTKDESVIEVYADSKLKIFSSMSESLAYQRTTPVKNNNGQGIKVCILDTGIYDSHSMFSGKKITKIDLSNGNYIEGQAIDGNGHGTHVAGIVTSVAPGAELLIAKVCNDDGSCWESDVMRGMQWCADNDARVVSISLGDIWYEDDCDNYPDAQLVNELTETKGILFSMAAGNSPGWFEQGYKVALPSCASKGISVAAVDVLLYSQSRVIVFNPANYDLMKCGIIRDSDGVPASACGGLELIDMTANGYVESAWIDGGLKLLSGTSMATPSISGAIASLMSFDPSKSSEEIRGILYEGAVKNYSAYGNGLLDVTKSCRLLLKDVIPTCEGYYATSDAGTSRLGSSTWFKLEIDGQEKYYSPRTFSTNKGVIDPMKDYYSKKKITDEIRKLNDRIYLLINKKTGIVDVNIWAIVTSKYSSVGYLQQLTPVSRSSTLKDMKAKESSLKFYSLDDCATKVKTSGQKCGQYLKEALDSFNPQLQNINTNTLEIVKA